MHQSTLDHLAESRIRDNLRYHSSLGPEAVSDRIRELEGQWGLERTLTAGLAGLGVFGLAMGLLGVRSFRLLTWLSLPLLFAYSLGKWAPPVSITARRGLRSLKEIEEERYALKALRGDFQQVPKPGAEESENLGRKAEGVLSAVRK